MAGQDTIVQQIAALVQQGQQTQTTQKPVVTQTDENIPKPKRMIDVLAPKWAYEASHWVAGQDSSWRGAVGLISIILLLIGLALLFGSGYTSIQGIRGPLARMQIIAESASFPGAVWWIIPGANVLIQVFAKRVPKLRVLWRPSIVYDGTTNAVFLAGWIGMLFLSYGSEAPIWMLGLLGAGLGFMFALAAEQAFLAAVCLFRAAATGKR